MLAGKPVVATRVDAIPEIVVDGENGLLVNVDDAVHTAEAVQNILENRGLQMKLRNNGMMTVHEKYDVKRTVKDSEMLLNIVRNKGGYSKSSCCTIR